MEFRVISPSRGLVWFKGAVRTLDKNPRGLLAVTLLLVLLEQIPNLLHAIPELSMVLSVVFLLLGPTLVSGMLYAIGEAHAGRAVTLSQLFEGFRQRGARAQLLLLGVLSLVAFALIYLVWQRLFGADNLATLLKIAEQKIKPDSVEAQAMAGPLFQSVLASVAILWILLWGLFFGIPRVMFDSRSALPAFFESVAACAMNVLPLAVYWLLLCAAMFVVLIAMSVASAVLGALGTVGSVLLGVVMVAVLVVALLVNTSGNYLAWREVFGHGDASMPPVQGGIIV